MLTLREAEMILFRTADDDMTGLERALVVAVKAFQEELRAVNARLDRLEEGTGNWKERR